MSWFTDRFKKRSEEFTPPERWIDLHSHILPGVDDGAKSLAKSMKMVRQAVSIGITHIVATPHFSDLFPACEDDRNSALKMLKDAVADSGINVEITTGWEVSFTDVHIKNINAGENYRISGSEYTLMELPAGLNKSAIIEGIFSLLISGEKIILAHPERNPLVQRDIELLKELKLRGVMFQIDAGSILGEYGKSAKKTSFDILKNGEGDIISSDAHSSGGYSNYERACRVVCQRFGKEVINKAISDTPMQITAAK